MPTKQEWIRVHAYLTAKLHLPCKLEFADNELVKIGRHEFEMDYSIEDYPSGHTPCTIYVNPTVDFNVPEHLILHEGAHHRAILKDPYCGHDEFWAKILCEMYEEAGFPLPEGTGFEAFAKVAGIRWKTEYHVKVGIERNWKEGFHKDRARLRRGPGMV
jgi:hypothetical protein